jgi:hypothetical protein
MENRNAKALEKPIVEARQKLVLVETAQKLLHARDNLAQRREYLAVGDESPGEQDLLLGRHVKLSFVVNELDLELKDLPLYTGDNFQEVLTALAKSCEFAAEAMLIKAGVGKTNP